MTYINDPSLKSWVEVSPQSDFPIQNIPFGIISTAGQKRAATAIGDYVLDLAALADAGMLALDGLKAGVLAQSTLNDLIECGKPVTNALRERISVLLRHDNAELRDHSELRSRVLLKASDVEVCMPVQIGDYTDFYSSIDHATNVGVMFRDPENALLPNWKHLPVGYHGRSSSIVVSGTDIHRPKGQQMPAGADKPVFGPSRLFDFELEVAFVTGKATELGTSIEMSEAEDHIFGLLLFNDLSARDIQKWEYVPLGPFLAKNFGSVVSPWIVTLEALEPFRVEGYDQEPEVLPYLKYSGRKNYNLNLEVAIQAPGVEPKTVSQSNFRYMYWNMCQQLVHQTVNGCNVNVGDLYASGTISGPDENSYGSMLEISWQGTKPVAMPDGSERKFIQDGDTIIMKGWGEKDGVRIGFGDVVTTVLPAT